MRSIKWLLSLLSLDFILLCALLRHTYNKIKHNMNNISPDVCCIKKKKKEQKCSVSLVTTVHRLQDTFIEAWSHHIVQAIVYWKSYWWILKIFFLLKSRNNVAK